VDDYNNQRFCLEWAAKQLGVGKLDDWYKVTYTELNQTVPGRALMRVLGYSLQIVVAAVYPQHQWHPWQFVKSPHGFWAEGTSATNYMQWLAKVTGVNTANASEWAIFSRTNISKLHGGSLIAKAGGLPALFARLSPLLLLYNSNSLEETTLVWKPVANPQQYFLQKAVSMLFWNQITPGSNPKLFSMSNSK